MNKAVSQRPAETILVVDDNEAVLRVVVKILEAENFHVLSATDGPSAIQFAGATSETIDLLLSDVDMPEMSGPDLGAALKRSRPDIRVMLMSGGGNGNLPVLNYGWAYIQKPFVAAKLLQMVTEVLNSPNRSRPGGRNSTAARTPARSRISAKHSRPGATSAGLHAR